jgi:hypothetical protein
MAIAARATSSSSTTREESPSIVDVETGAWIEVELFIALLGRSNAYAEVSRTERCNILLQLAVAQHLVAPAFDLTSSSAGGYEPALVLRDVAFEDVDTSDAQQLLLARSTLSRARHFVGSSTALEIHERRP